VRIYTPRVRSLLVAGLLLAGVGAAGMGCSTSVTTPPVNNGTPLGVATLRITGTAYVDNTVVSHSVYLTVNVIPPGSAAVAGTAAVALPAASVRKSIVRR